MTFLPLFSLTDATDISGFGLLIVVVVLAALALFVKLLSSVINKSSKKGTEENKQQDNVTPAPVEAPKQETTDTQTPVETAPELPYTPGYVTLDGVSEQDAAVIMAITSDKTGIPLERLCFKSIRRLNQEPQLENIEDQDAAVIMAIVANKTGISLDNLIFNSIKSVEE